MCHSPSHFIAIFRSDPGWAATYRSSLYPPGSVSLSSSLSIDRMAYTGLSTFPATSPVTYTTGIRFLW